VNGKELLEAMSFIDEEWVQASEAPPRAHRPGPWIRAAACVCLLIMGLWSFHIFGNQAKKAESAIEETSLYESQADNALGADCVEAAPAAPAAEPMETEAPRSVELSSAVVLVTELAEDGFTGSIQENALSLAQDTQVRVLFMEDFTPGVLPEVGQHCRVFVSYMDPDTLTLWISAMEPEE